MGQKLPCPPRTCLALVNGDQQTKGKVIKSLASERVKGGKGSDANSMEWRKRVGRGNVWPLPSLCS